MRTCAVQFRSSKTETAFGFCSISVQTERNRNVNFLLICTVYTVGVNKKLTLRFRSYGVNTVRHVEKKDYETIPYQGDNRVDETKEAFFGSTERATKAFRRQRRKFVRMLAFSNGQSTPVTRRGDLRIF